MICEKNNAYPTDFFGKNTIGCLGSLRGVLFLRKDDVMNKQPSPEKIRRINNRLAPLMSSVSATDPQGMYTGVPEDPYEQPVQDADDL